MLPQPTIARRSRSIRPSCAAEHAARAGAALGRYPIWIEMGHPALLHQHVSVDDAGDDVRRPARVREVACEIVARREAEVVGFDDDEIGALADLEAPDLVLETER